MSYRVALKVPWFMLTINVDDQIVALEKSIKVWSFIVEKTAEIVNMLEIQKITRLPQIRTFLSDHCMTIPYLPVPGVTCTDFSYSMVLSQSIKSILLEHMFGETRIRHDCHCCEYGDSLGLNNTSTVYGICNVCPAKGFWENASEREDTCYFACERNSSPYSVWSEANDPSSVDFRAYDIKVKLTAARRVVKVLEEAKKALEQKKEIDKGLPRVNMWYQVQELQYNLGKRCRLRDVTHPAYEFYYMLIDIRSMNA